MMPAKPKKLLEESWKSLMYSMKTVWGTIEYAVCFITVAWNNSQACCFGVLVIQSKSELINQPLIWACRQNFTFYRNFLPIKNIVACSSFIKCLRRNCRCFTAVVAFWVLILVLFEYYFLSGKLSAQTLFSGMSANQYSYSGLYDRKIDNVRQILIDLWDSFKSSCLFLKSTQNPVKNSAGVKLQKIKPRPEMSTLMSANRNHKMHCFIETIMQYQIYFQTRKYPITF